MLTHQHTAQDRAAPRQSQSRHSNPHGFAARKYLSNRATNHHHLTSPVEQSEQADPYASSRNAAQNFAIRAACEWSGWTPDRTLSPRPIMTCSRSAAARFHAGTPGHERRSPDADIAQVKWCHRASFRGIWGGKSGRRAVCSRHIA